MTYKTNIVKCFVLIFVFLQLQVNCVNDKHDSTTFTTIVQQQKKKASFLKMITEVVPQTLRMDMNYFEEIDVLQVKLTSPNLNQFEIPDDILELKNHKPAKNVNLEEKGIRFGDSTNPLDFSLINPKTNSTLFKFLPSKMIYSPDYLSYSYELSDDLIFGYGERVHEFKLGQGIYTLWLNDTGTPYDDGKGGKNLYGHHPVVINACKDGSFFGILFFNLNAQDLVIGAPDTQTGKVTLEQRSIGGVIDFLLFKADSPNELVKKYHNLVGKPILPPLWSLGWHQCRWGYKNPEVMDEVVRNYTLSKIPLDVIWSDIDYMQNYRDFTIDSDNFKTLGATIKKWHNDSLHWVPIVDLGVALIEDGSYPFYEYGNQLDVYIKSNYTKKALVNNVWPGDCHFPDFTHPNASLFWHSGLDLLHKQAEYSGIWHDMNEPGLFTKGEKDLPDDPSKNKYAHLSYYPGNGRIDLEGHSISLNALVYGDGNREHDNTMYNFKPYNPFKQNEITSLYFQEKNQRPFILSRASLFGMGRYASHWLGDNYSTYESMKYSITGIFNYQIFGFNLVGSDICGFADDTTDKLCARWTVLGSFYPFSRNHNSIGQKDQEPYRVGPLTYQAAQTAINLRYSLLKYIYTRMFVNSFEGGNNYFKPMFFEFYKDKETYNYIDKQIMIGSGLMLCPALEESESDYDAYFPNANWAEFPSGRLVQEFNKSSSSGTLRKLSGAYDVINLFMRGGSIVPFQNTQKHGVLRTKGLYTIPTSLYINPDENNTARDFIIFDDGETLDAINKDKLKFLEVAAFLQNGSIYFISSGTSEYTYNNEDINLESVVLFRTKIENATLIDVNLKRVHGKVEYDSALNKSTITFARKVRLDKIASIDLK